MRTIMWLVGVGVVLVLVGCGSEDSKKADTMPPSAQGTEVKSEVQAPPSPPAY